MGEENPGQGLRLRKDKDGALAEYNRVRADREAVRKPRPKSDDGITVMALSNIFLTAKRQRVDSVELSPRMWAGNHRACDSLCDEFGKGRAVTASFLGLRVGHPAHESGQGVDDIVFVPDVRPPRIRNQID